MEVSTCVFQTTGVLPRTGGCEIRGPLWASGKRIFVSKPGGRHPPKTKPDPPVGLPDMRPPCVAYSPLDSKLPYWVLVGALLASSIGLGGRWVPFCSCCCAKGKLLLAPFLFCAFSN